MPHEDRGEAARGTRSSSTSRIENADSDVWAKLDKRDDKLWTEEADEIMIDADGNGRSYVELQVAPNGNLFDTYLPERRKYEDTINPKMKPFSWNSKTIAKVRVDGTLNKREDQDKGWTAELAIPLEDVKGMDDKSDADAAAGARQRLAHQHVPHGRAAGQAAAGGGLVAADGGRLPRARQVRRARVRRRAGRGAAGRAARARGRRRRTEGGHRSLVRPAAANGERKAAASKAAGGGSGGGKKK